MIASGPKRTSTVRTTVPLAIARRMHCALSTRSTLPDTWHRGSMAEPSAVNSVNRATVCGPATPTTDRPNLAWKRRRAVLVALVYVPVIGPE